MFERRHQVREIFERCPDNPLITADDLSFSASSVYNPGAVDKDGDVVLLARVEDRTGFSSIHVARSSDGIGGWEVCGEPLLACGDPDMRYETRGCEDARVTYIAEEDRYCICYVAYSKVGPAIGLAQTADFEEAERLGLILSPPNKDTVMFPEKISGDYMVLHRPVAGDKEHIWSASSPDLVHWGFPHCVLVERGGPWWDGVKVGAAAPPIRVEDGWLLLYHGVKKFGGNMVYRVGAALLHLQQPHKVLARTPGWIFGPDAPYETNGYMPNVVFPCGCLVRGDELWMYYGAADTSVCLARARLSDILEHLEENAGL
jgi:predicted GH43/DUF377 family glycosyl hydrolase